MRPYEDERGKKQQVEAMFDGIAPAYDRLNDIMSFGIARGWRRRTVRTVAQAHPHTILDLATGTGDLAIAMARKLPQGVRITGADLSRQMLALAAAKIEAKGLSDTITLIRAEAEELPFADGQFDAVTAAFGVRNFQDLDAGLREMHRVLVRGGRVFVLEFSTPRGKIFGAVYRFYFNKVLPRIGGAISKDLKAYTYLPSSVEEFPAPQKFLGMLAGCGFKDCRARSMTGGVVYLYTGVKE